MAEKLHTIIVFTTTYQCYKYRNINSTGLKSFFKFANNQLNFGYYNIYDKQTKAFIERIYISNAYRLTFYYIDGRPPKKTGVVFNYDCDLITEKNNNAAGVNIYNLKSKQTETIKF